MSVIYYCDGPGCAKKEPGVAEDGWTGPVGWMYNIDDDGNILDACSEQHLDEAVAANAPPEPEDEEGAEEAEEDAETE